MLQCSSSGLYIDPRAKVLGAAVQGQACMRAPMDATSTSTQAVCARLHCFRGMRCIEEEGHGHNSTVKLKCDPAGALELELSISRDGDCVDQSSGTMTGHIHSCTRCSGNLPCCSDNLPSRLQATLLFS